MKKFSILVFLFSPIAFGLTSGSAELLGEFHSIFDEIMYDSNGRLNQLDCGNDASGNGIMCLANITLIDTVSNGSPQGGGEETCTEAYTYDKADGFNTVCSTCEYSKTYGNYQTSCSLKTEEVKTGKYTTELIKALEQAKYFGYLSSYETPIYMGEAADFAGDIKILDYEVYKLNYTYTVGDEDENGHIRNPETFSVCEYIKYDHEVGDYSLTNVGCDKPWTYVYDEKLIDEF